MSPQTVNLLLCNNRTILHVLWNTRVYIEYKKKQKKKNSEALFKMAMCKSCEIKGSFQEMNGMVYCRLMEKNLIATIQVNLS